MTTTDFSYSFPIDLEFVTPPAEIMAAFFCCDRREPLLWILGKNDRPTVTLEVTLGNARVGEGLGRWSGVGDGVSGGFLTR